VKPEDAMAAAAEMAINLVTGEDTPEAKQVAWEWLVGEKLVKEVMKGYLLSAYLFGATEDATAGVRHGVYSDLAECLHCRYILREMATRLFAWGYKDFKEGLSCDGT